MQFSHLFGVFFNEKHWKVHQPAFSSGKPWTICRWINVHQFEHIRTHSKKDLALYSLLSCKLNWGQLLVWYFLQSIDQWCIFALAIQVCLCFDIHVLVICVIEKNAPVSFAECSDFSSLKHCNFCNIQRLLAIINRISCLHTFASTQFMIIQSLSRSGDNFYANSPCAAHVEKNILHCRKKSQIYPGVWSLHHIITAILFQSDVTAKARKNLKKIVRFAVLIAEICINPA